MKSTRIALMSFLGILWAQSIQGQSQFWLYSQNFGVNAQVFDAFGQPLEGPSYQVELWGGATSDSLVPTLGAFTRGRVIIPFGRNGHFIDLNPDGGGYSTVFSVSPNFFPSWLQVRAWDARLGATYEDAVALGQGGFGESPLFQAIGTDPFTFPPNTPGALIGLQSFSLRPIPEPSTWALLALGGASCLVWRRRGRHSDVGPRSQ